ncbi:MAG: glycosyltransferase family 2 protein [Ferruginibacter sp.]
MVKCSLLISTYNWPQALGLCLQSVMQQTVLPDEVIICDDGSKTETAELIKKFQADFSVPLLHVWQADIGFQLAQIRNKGFAIAKGEYIIQVDGDLILHKDFVKDHLNFKMPGSFSTGSRVLISAELTTEMFRTNSIDVNRYSKNNNNYFNRLHLPFLQDFLATRYKNKGKWKYYVKGCNMAFWKKDLVAVNGYNEDFTGWGKEDSEIAIRLINNNVSKRFIKLGAICYHLYHNEVSREMEQNNKELMQKSADDKIIYARNGMNKYL